MNEMPQSVQVTSGTEIKCINHRKSDDPRAGFTYLARCGGEGGLLSTADRLFYYCTQAKNIKHFY